MSASSASTQLWPQICPLPTKPPETLRGLGPTTRAAAHSPQPTPPAATHLSTNHVLAQVSNQDPEQNGPAKGGHRKNLGEVCGVFKLPSCVATTYPSQRTGLGRRTSPQGIGSGSTRLRVDPSHTQWATERHRQLAPTGQK